MMFKKSVPWIFAFLLSACGGGSMDDYRNDEISPYRTDEEKLTYLKSVLVDLYTEENISLSYIPQILDHIRPWETVPSPETPGTDQNYELIGELTLEQMLDQGNDYAMGILEMNILVDENKFNGRVYKIKQVNTGWERVMDEFAGELTISGELVEYGVFGLAEGTLINQSGQATFYKFEIGGGWRPNIGGPADLSGGVDQVNGALYGTWVAVPK